MHWNLRWNSSVFWDSLSRRLELFAVDFGLGKRVSAHDFARSRAQLINAANHLQFSRIDEFRQNRIQALESFDALSDIRLDDVGKLVAGLTCHHFDHRSNRVDEGADGPGERIVGFDMFDRRLAGTAPAVPQHHNEPDAQLRNGIFDAPLHRRARAADDIPRDADDKQIADSLVKDQLRCDP